MPCTQDTLRKHQPNSSEACPETEDLPCMDSTQRLTSGKGELISSPLLYSLPQDVLSIVTNFLPQSRKIALSQTSRALKCSSTLEYALYKEPISMTDFPMILADIEEEERQRVLFPYATGLHEKTGYLEDLLSLRGLGGLDDHVYLSSTKCRKICRGINEHTGLHVRRLTIPYFLTLEEIRPFAVHCPNLRALDFGSVIRAEGFPDVDSRAHDPITEPLRTNPPFNLGWAKIVNHFPTLFANLKELKVSYNGLNVVVGEHSNILINLLRSSRRLESIELIGRYNYNTHKELQARDGLSVRQFPTPGHTLRLIEILSTHTPTTLKELRLNCMLHLTINLSTLLKSMTENYPALKEFSLSVNQDLKMLGYINPGSGIELLHAERAIHDGRAITCLQYLQMLQTIAQLKTESGSPRFLIKSLERCLDQSIPPQSLSKWQDYPQPDSNNSELFRWLSHEMAWVPTFSWSNQTKFQSLWQEAPFDLGLLTSEHREMIFARCRSVFQEVKDAGLPVRLQLSTDNHKNHEGSKFAFFLRDWLPPPDDGYGLEYDARLRARWPGASHWYLEGIGTLIDHLKVTWSNKFLRETRYNYENWFAYNVDARPQPERANDEKKEMQYVWDHLRDHFPNLSRLELYIPALVYVGDETFLKDLLPGSGWQIQIGKDIVVKDYRTLRNIRPQADVVFLDRVFYRDEVAW